MELAYLGSLLGLPNILDPMFPLAFSTFLNTLPPGLGKGGGAEVKMEETQPEEKPAAVDTSNVSHCLIFVNHCLIFVNHCLISALHCLISALHCLIFVMLDFCESLLDVLHSNMTKEVQVCYIGMIVTCSDIHVPAYQVNLLAPSYLLAF